MCCVVMLLLHMLRLVCFHASYGVTETISAKIQARPRALLQGVCLRRP